MLADQLRQTRLLGLPVQFVAVALISAALVIYLSGWAALSRVEARADTYRVSAFGEPVAAGRPADSSITPNADVEEQTWERVALFVCPLH